MSDSVEYEWHVLLRSEQDLYGLPAHEAAEGDGGDGGGFEIPGGVVVAVGGLEGVAAAEDLPYVGDGLVGRVDEEFCVARAKWRAVSEWNWDGMKDKKFGILTVIVAAYSLVEGSKLARLEGLVLLVAEVVDLSANGQSISSALRGAWGVLTMCMAMARRRASKVFVGVLFAS